MKKVIYDGSTYDYLMRNGKFAVGINTPPALSGEQTFGLPPYCKRMPYLIDKYPACPKDWMRSEGIVKSFFVPVVKDAGMWLDFNENSTHTHHVAIVISVQGVNPITGMPCNDAQLEQYIEECPKHKIKFGPDRYCKKCDYKWPKQNYVSTTATPNGMFWLDGFRSVEGIVRQYILTAEKMRGVASNIIGKNRVYAIGLSFFVSKEKKPIQVDAGILRGGGIIYGQPNFFSPVHAPINWQIPSSTCNGGMISPAGAGADVDTSISCASGSSTSMTSTLPPSSKAYDNKKGTYADTSNTYADISKKYKSSKRSKKATASELAAVQKQLEQTPNDPNFTINVYHAMSIGNIKPIQTTKLEIGAGAKINQSVHDDPEKLEYWHDKPEAIICINYATEDEVRKIVEAGEINIEGHKEGFLKEVPVGN